MGHLPNRKKAILRGNEHLLEGCKIMNSICWCEIWHTFPTLMLQKIIMFGIRNCGAMVLSIVGCAGGNAGMQENEIVSRQSDFEMAEDVSSSQALQPIAEYPLDAFEDSAGRLWLGSVGSGVFRLDSSGLLEAFHTADGLVGERNMGFAEGPDGSIWFTSAKAADGSSPTLMQYVHGRFVKHPFPPAFGGGLAGVHFDKQGQMWLNGTAGIFRFQSNRFERFALPGGPPPPGYTPHSWFEASDGRLWLGTPDRGLFVWDGSTFECINRSRGLLTNNAQVLCEDDSGQIWISCFHWHLPDADRAGGVCRWNGKEMTTFPETEGLHANEVYAGHCDRRGQVWLGATGVGVLAYNGQDFILHNQFDERVAVPPGARRFGMNDIREDRAGRMLFCFTGGLFLLSDSGFVHQPAPPRRI